MGWCTPMSDNAQPPSGLAPRFRIVAGRGLGERSPSLVAQSPQPDPRSNQVSHAQGASSGPLIQQQPIGLSTHQSPQVSSGPGTPQGGVNVSLPAEGPSGQPADEVVGKCVRFFRTLICLSQQPDHNRHTAQTVNELVSNVIFGNMPPEEFTKRLQVVLQSQAQPHLLPFLQRTLPFLRTAISNGEVVIDGISTPPGFQVNTSRAVGNHAAVSQSPHPVPMTVARPPAQMPFPNMPPRMPPTNTPQMQVPGGYFPPQELKNDQAPEEEKHQQHHEDEAVQVRLLQESALKSALLRPEDIMKKITQRMNEACYVEEEVLTLISDATEYRLRELLVELAVLAEHRVDPLRLNPNYGPLDDTRRQIRFLETIDRQQEELRENREKEALIRMSKSKGIARDTIERAKEMQRADAEAKRNRDANAAAIAALSGNRSTRPKWDQIGGSSVSNIVRPRTIRVNIRDLHALANQDPLCSRTKLLHKLAMSGGQQTESL